MASYSDYKTLLTEERPLSLDAGDLTLAFDDLIKYYNDNNPLPIKSAEISTESETLITVTGTVDYLGVKDIPCTVTAQELGTGDTQITMRMRLIEAGMPSVSNKWTFGHSFPSLPTVDDYTTADAEDGEEASVAFLNGLFLTDTELVLTTHAHHDLSRDIPLVAGLNFVSSWKPEGLLGVLEYIRDQDSLLTLYGTIREARPTEETRELATGETVWLRDDLPGINLKAKLSLDFTLGESLAMEDTYFQLYSPTNTYWLLDDNLDFVPQIAVAGTLKVPSADMALPWEATIEDGVQGLKLRTYPENVTLGNLAGLMDLAGSDSLQSQLPESLQGALETLESLALTRLELDIMLANSLPVLGRVDLTIGFPNLYWQIWEGHFQLNSLLCDITVNNPFANPLYSNPNLAYSQQKKPTVFLGVRGLMEIEEQVQLMVETRSEQGWAVNAYMPEGNSIPLGKFLSTWIPDLPAPADLTIDQLSLSFSPGKSYSFMTTLSEYPKAWTIPIGTTELSISDVYMNLSKSSGSSITGGFGGALTLAGQTVFVNYGIPGNIEILGNFQNLSMQEIVSTILGKKADLPEGLDFTFSTATVLISKQEDDYLFQVGANIEGFGFMGFEIRRHSTAGWGIVAGMSLLDVKLSKLPGLSSLEAFEKVVDLQELSLFLATYDGATLQFPNMAKFNNPTLINQNVPVTPGTGGLVAGVNFSAKWQLDTSKQELALLKTILGLDPTMEVTIQVSKVPTQNSRLYFSFTTAFNNGQDPFTGQMGFAMVNGSPSLFLAGIYQTTIQGQKVRFDAAMSLVKGGIFFSGSMAGTLKFGDVQVSNLALALGFNWAAIPTLGFSASLNISGWQSSLTILVDSTDPSKSLLAGAISDVNLAEIANSLAEGDIPKEIEDILEQLEITGTKPFNIPYDEIAVDLDECDLSPIVTAFKKYGKRDISSNTEQVLMVVGKAGKKWSLTDMGTTSLRHYQLEQVGKNVQVSLNPQFYLAPMGAQMGSLKFPQGYFITGTLNIMGLKWTSYVEIRGSQGIAVSSQLNKPFTIHDPGFFTLADVDGLLGPKLSISTFKQPDLEDKSLRNPHFYINGSVTLLGVENETYIKATSAGFEFMFSNKSNYSIPSNSVFGGSLSGNSTLNATIGNNGTFSGGASFSMNVKGYLDLKKLLKIDGMPKLTVDFAVSGSVSMGYDGAKAWAKASGSFKFDGQTHRFDVTLQATNAQIKDAGQWVLDKLESVVEDLLDTGEKVVQALEDGWLAVEGGAEEAAKILSDGYNMAKKEALATVSDAYNLGADAVAEVGKGLDMAADEVGDFMKNVKGFGDDAVSGALQGAKYATEEVWDFMQDAYGWFKHIDVKHYDQGSVRWHADASKKIHLDKKTHFDLGVAHWRPHLDAGERIGVNKRIDVTPHLDLPHADVKPTPQNPHIDNKGLNIKKGKYGGQSFTSPHADFRAEIKKKILGKNLHLDIGHADAKVKITAPKLPTSHMDVGHVDVGSSLKNPNKTTTKVKGRN